MKTICEINGIRFYEARADRYGNPRVSVHWTDFLNYYEGNDYFPGGDIYINASKRAKKCGFTPCRGRNMEGFFARQCFDVRAIAKRIIEERNN